MAYRPMTRIWTAAALTTSPVTTQSMRDHLRVTHDFEDGEIASYIMAATATVEKRTNRLLQSRACVLRLMCLPVGQGAVELQGGQVNSITSVLVDGVAVTGATAIGDSPALLIPAADWPVAAGENYPVVITYTAGYTTVPQQLVHAIKLIAADLFTRRNNSDEAALHDVPISADYLMGDLRIWGAA